MHECRCRYVGHCNCATDIKEVTFLGSNDELVACSSDDGCVFIYDAVCMPLLQAPVYAVKQISPCLPFTTCALQH